MENKSMFWFFIAVFGVAIFYLWQKSRAQSAAMQRTDIASPVARGARDVATVSGSWLRSIPVVGAGIDNAINSPVTNVTSGDWNKTIGSAVTGGVSDFIPKLNPLNWGW